MPRLPHKQARKGDGSSHRARLLTGGEDQPAVTENPANSTGVPLGYVEPRPSAYAQATDRAKRAPTPGTRETKRSKARRLAALAQIQADSAADAVVESGEPVALPVMEASERQVVHDRLRDRAEVETRSEGEEPERHVVVFRA